MITLLIITIIGAGAYTGYYFGKKNAVNVTNDLLQDLNNIDNLTHEEALEQLHSSIKDYDTLVRLYNDQCQQNMTLQNTIKQATVLFTKLTNDYMEILKKVFDDNTTQAGYDFYNFDKDISIWLALMEDIL